MSSYKYKSSFCLKLLILISVGGFHLVAQGKEARSLDPVSGFAIGTHYELVRNHCTACHSAKLVTQNRMSREGWLSTIRWMQKTQGLWPLAEQESKILDYLEKYYSPVATGRRPPIPSHLMPAAPITPKDQGL
jgi:hypothetical protein